VLICLLSVLLIGGLAGSAVIAYELDKTVAVRCMVNHTIIANRQGDITPVDWNYTESALKGCNQSVLLIQIRKNQNDTVPYSVSQGNCVPPDIPENIHTTNFSHSANLNYMDPVLILDGQWLSKEASVVVTFLFRESLSHGDFLDVFLLKYESCYDDRIKCVDNGNYVSRHNVSQDLHDPLKVPIPDSSYYYLLVRSGKRGSVIQASWKYNLNFNYYSSDNNVTTICRGTHSKPDCVIYFQEDQCYFISTDQVSGQPQFYFYQVNAIAERSRKE